MRFPSSRVSTTVELMSLARRFPPTHLRPFKSFQPDGFRTAGVLPAVPSMVAASTPSRCCVVTAASAVPAGESAVSVVASLPAAAAAAAAFNGPPPAASIFYWVPEVPTCQLIGRLDSSHGECECECELTSTR